jgi:flavin reductase (DIM6/NTAB) family NADH-FMN oxidoreductase RutF
MKRLIMSVLLGQSLRHRAVALRPFEQKPVRAIAAVDGAERDISAMLFPISLNPLLLGIAAALSTPDKLTIRMEDREFSKLLGILRVTSAGSIERAAGKIALLRPAHASVRCIPPALLMQRYALAWRQAQRNLKDPHAFHMSFADLKALNVFYMMPRPVYLVSVVHKDASNIFPMDLVGALGDDRFLLALRLTSPSVELMRESGRIVVAGAPAAMKQQVYQLGAHHRKRSIDWGALPFAVEPSPDFGIPALSGPLGLSELEVLHSESVGSHMVFLTSVANRILGADEPQLCHVSDMYAHWRARHGRPFTDS